MSYFKPISISLSPNVEKDDLHLALNLIIRPWFWKKGKAVEKIEESFRDYFGVKYAVSFNSGRSSFYAILKSLDLKVGEEVLLQAFTCNAVPNPILWSELSPVYIDCNVDDLNMSAENLESRIGPNSKAVVIQHTFGLPADIKKIKEICEKRNIILIEDCAHSLGAEFDGKKVGTFGKAAFFSFSRDKIISSVYGGIAITNDDNIGEELKKLQRNFGLPKSGWIFQQILHPILLGYVILPIYNFFDLGKIFLIFSQWFHILSKAVSWQEKRGQKPNYFPKALPNAQAMMALNQFRKIDKFNNKRQKLAEYYYEKLKGSKFELPKDFKERKNVFLRFSIMHRDAHIIIYEAWHKENMLLGDWYTTPIAPFDTKNDQVGYKKGSCPNAEWLSGRTLNLPTHINISEKDSERVVNFLLGFKK